MNETRLNIVCACDVTTNDQMQNVGMRNRARNQHAAMVQVSQ